jgi:hypothetical protein
MGDYSFIKRRAKDEGRTRGDEGKKIKSDVYLADAH